MWNRWFVLSVIFLSFRASLASETSEGFSLETSAPQENYQKTERKYSIDGFLELRSTDSKLKKDRGQNSEGVYELSVGGTLDLDPYWGLSFEGASERWEGEDNTFFVKEALVRWSLPKWLEVRAGQMLLPVGYLNERDQLYAQNPHYYSTLLTEKKAVDAGVVTKVTPLGSDLFQIEGGVFSGNFVRPEDEKRTRAQQRPWFVSLKSESEWHSFFVTHYRHDFSFYDPVAASGVGAELKTPEPYWGWLEVGLLGEYWWIYEEQKGGPDQLTRAYFVDPWIGWKFVSLGYRYGQERTRVGGTSSGLELPELTSEVFHADLRYKDLANLRVEKALDQDTEPIRDEWTARFILTWKLE